MICSKSDELSDSNQAGSNFNLILVLLSRNVIALMRHTNGGIHTLWNCLQQKLTMYDLAIYQKAV